MHNVEQQNILIWKRLIETVESSSWLLHTEPNNSKSCIISITGKTLTVRDCAEGFAKAKVNNIHHLPLIHRASGFILEGSQADEAQFAFQKSILAAPSQQRVLYIAGNGFYKECL